MTNKKPSITMPKLKVPKVGGVKKPVIKSKPVVKKPVIKKPVVKEPEVTEEEVLEEEIVVEGEQMPEEEVEVVEQEEEVIEEEIEEEEEMTIKKPVIKSKPVAKKPAVKKPVVKEPEVQMNQEEDSTKTITVKRPPIPGAIPSTNTNKKSDTFKPVTYEEVFESIDTTRTLVVKQKDIRALIKSEIDKNPDLEHLQSLTLKDYQTIMSQYYEVMNTIMSTGFEATFDSVLLKRKDMPTRLWKPTVGTNNKYRVSNVNGQHIKYSLSIDIDKPTPEENLQGTFDEETSIFTTDDGEQYQLELNNSIVTGITKLN